jgi:hypothetical protein
MTRIALFTTALVLALCVRATYSDAQPVRLTVACERATDLTFRLTFDNIDRSPTVVVIGTILGNDGRYVLSPIHFTLRDRSGADTNFDYSELTRVGGRLDQWLVPLPVEASYSVRVSLASRYRDTFATARSVSISLTTQENQGRNLDVQGLRFIHVWSGLLTSNTVTFPGQCG